MKLDLKNIAGAYGGRIPFSYEADLSQEVFYGEHPFKKPVKLIGEVENHLGVLVLRGHAEGEYETHCARCLCEVTVPLKADCEVVLSPDGEEREDVYVLEGDYVEVDDILLPALMMEIRMVYYCHEDCKGLCPTCGKDLNEGPCSCKSVEVDERLAILKTLLEKQ